MLIHSAAPRLQTSTLLLASISAAGAQFDWQSAKEAWNDLEKKVRDVASETFGSSADSFIAEQSARYASAENFPIFPNSADHVELSAEEKEKQRIAELYPKTTAPRQKLPCLSDGPLPQDIIEQELLAAVRAKNKQISELKPEEAWRRAFKFHVSWDLYETLMKERDEACLPHWMVSSGQLREKGLYLPPNIIQRFDPATYALFKEDRKTKDWVLYISREDYDRDQKICNLRAKTFQIVEHEEKIYAGLTGLIENHFLKADEPERLKILRFSTWRASVPFLMPDLLSLFSLPDDKITELDPLRLNEVSEAFYNQWWLPLYQNWDTAQQQIAQENWPLRELQQAWRQAVAGTCSGIVRSSGMGTLGDVTRTDHVESKQNKACYENPEAAFCNPLKEWVKGLNYLWKIVPDKQQLQELNNGLPTPSTIYSWEKKDYDLFIELNKKVHEYATPEKLDAYYGQTNNTDIFRFDPEWMFTQKTCSHFSLENPSADELFTGSGHSSKLGSDLRGMPKSRSLPKELLGGDPYFNGWNERFELWENPPPPPPPPPPPIVYNLDDVPRVFDRACKELCDEGVQCPTEKIWRKARGRVEYVMDGKLYDGVEQKLDEEDFDWIVDSVKQESKGGSCDYNPSTPCDCTLPKDNSEVPPQTPEDLPSSLQTWVQYGATTILLIGITGLVVKWLKSADLSASADTRRSLVASKR